MTSSIFLPEPISLAPFRAASAAAVAAASRLSGACCHRRRGFIISRAGGLGFRGSFRVVANTTLNGNSAPKGGAYIVADFMTKKEKLHVVKPSTTVDEALEALVDNRISGFPVVDDDWNLVGVVSDYDLIALDSISGSRSTKNSMFPEVDSSWKVFNEIQKLLNKTDGQVIADVMTPAPLVVRETTNLEDAARLLLKTRYRRLPVVDADGKLVGIITRGHVIRAALHIKRNSEQDQ
ncbi:CBS domain-containing protein [Drosera capensis]